MYIFQIIFLL